MISFNPPHSEKRVAHKPNPEIVLQLERTIKRLRVVIDEYKSNGFQPSEMIEFNLLNAQHTIRNVRLMFRIEE